MSPSYHQELAARYRELANRELGLGRFRRAAYIYAHLLGDYVAAALQRGEKIPGMGHREYRVVDPRARFLREWAAELSKGTEHENIFDVLCEIDGCFSEAMLEKGKALHANVEFYKGLVLRVAGLPNRFFTAAFAMARVFGYVAHFMESRTDNRIYRPAARYDGRLHVDTESLQAQV